MKYIEKIKESASFHEGMQTLRQLSFGLLDMHWHGQNPSEIKSVKEFENNAFADIKLYPDVSENCMSTAFSHIFWEGTLPDIILINGQRYWMLMLLNTF